MGEFVSEAELQGVKHMDDNDGIRDFSQPIRFDLQTGKPKKTVDIGRDGTSLSLDPYGRILQASTFHPVHGIVVAVPFAQFDGSQFHCPAYVRSYRKRMLQCIQDDGPGLGFDIGSRVDQVWVNIPEANVATFTFSVDTSIDIFLRVEVLEGGDILQSVIATNMSSKSADLLWSVNLSASLNRASYGQLTEGGPIPLPRSHNVLLPGSYDRVNIVNPDLGAQLAFSFDTDDINQPSGWPSNGLETYDHPLDLRIPQRLHLTPLSSHTIDCKFRLLPHTQPHSFTSLPRKPQIHPKNSDHNTSPSPSPSPWKQPTTPTTYILRRATDYILSACTIPVSPLATCIITDHVALPLGWNRDNYWQLRLLEASSHLGVLSSRKTTRVLASVVPGDGEAEGWRGVPIGSAVLSVA
ncbi:hypothetical protein GRF29_28g2367413 [Pseudopithomyces chartarum]|uniref:Uncharacterized protein n=1 Tax=Pseudopithomyces chartarum TaxID=1892770 RepID=A0AAN6M2S2_9PLEO|nr:hypothetical protein GRF29_28g2367413 [Pseudopithomyces chartarum]